MENISKNAEANTVSAVHQLDPTKYVRITEKPGAKLKVLFVGNSITRHMPLPSIGWTGDWGMAASCEEKDYVHQTVRLLEEKLGEPVNFGGVGGSLRGGGEAAFRVLHPRAGLQGGHRYNPHRREREPGEGQAEPLPRVV